MSYIEPLEARIAPAVVITNPLPDLVAGIGKAGDTLDLSQLTATASSSAYHTKVQFVTNYDTDATTPGIQAGVIELELYDDLAPLTVQNFLAYVNNANTKGDYDGTLFHRAVTGFILQGGGFETASLTPHIPVFPTVHNEADATNRSNVAGTLAMAKVSGDPNSATSEWFINLADNSANLDNANGGFTVFGKVLGDGLTLANQITALSRINVGASDGGGTPVQNGVPIKIVDAKVIPGTPATTTGLTYTVESITPGANTAADLVKTSINGSTLNVNYTGTKSGTAQVTVKVSDGTTSATDTFNVKILPNYSVSLADDMLPGWLVPGDTGTVKVNVSNSGGASGGGTVSLYLMKINVTKDSSGLLTGYTDVDPASTIALAGSSKFSVTSGQTKAVSVAVKLPATPFGADETYYRLVAQVVPNDTTQTQEELFSDDNLSRGLSTHDLVNKFGTLSDVNYGTRVVTLKYPTQSTNAQPATVTWSIKGPGVGTVGFDSQGNDISLSVQNTTLVSTLSPKLSLNASRISLGQIDLANGIATAALGSVDLSGPFSASSGIKSLVLGDVTGQALFTIGTVLSDPTVKATLSLRNVKDLSVESSEPLASLTVASWLDTDANNDSIVAPSLGKLVATGTGNFEADVKLTDEAVPLASLTIGGYLRNATIQTAGDIGVVKLGGIQASNLFAGVMARPTSVADFADPHKITSFAIAGIKGVTDPLFVASQVAAQTIGTISVKGVSTAASATSSGFVADVINSYARPGVATKTKLSGATVYDDDVDGASGYSVTVL